MGKLEPTCLGEHDLQLSARVRNWRTSLKMILAASAKDVVTVARTLRGMIAWFLVALLLACLTHTHTHKHCRICDCFASFKPEKRQMQSFSTTALQPVESCCSTLSVLDSMNPATIGNVVACRQVFGTKSQGHQVWAWKLESLVPLHCAKRCNAL